MRWIGPALVTGLIGALSAPAVAHAHGLVQRQQLPIPQWLFAWSAAALLAVTILAGCLGSASALVAVVVLGHVAGLVLAHDRALVLYKDSRLAARSQYWMLGVMVGFTSLALWLLAQAA